MYTRVRPAAHSSCACTGQGDGVVRWPIFPSPRRFGDGGRVKYTKKKRKKCVTVGFYYTAGDWQFSATYHIRVERIFAIDFSFIRRVFVYDKTRVRADHSFLLLHLSNSSRRIVCTLLHRWFPTFFLNFSRLKRSARRLSRIV